MIFLIFKQSNNAHTKTPKKRYLSTIDKMWYACYYIGSLISWHAIKEVCHEKINSLVHKTNDCDPHITPSLTFWRKTRLWRWSHRLDSKSQVPSQRHINHRDQLQIWIQYSGRSRSWQSLLEAEYNQWSTPHLIQLSKEPLLPPLIRDINGIHMSAGFRVWSMINMWWFTLTKQQVITYDLKKCNWRF